MRRTGQQRRPFLPPALSILPCAVGRARLPSARDKPPPLAGQSAHGGLVTCAPRSWRPRGGFRPKGMVQGLSGLRMAACRSNCSQKERHRIQGDCPRRSTTGATPEKPRQASTGAHRSLSGPRAAVSRAAETGPVPGSETNRGESSGLRPSCPIAESKARRASRGLPLGGAGLAHAHGGGSPACSVGKGTAAWRAAIRCPRKDVRDELGIPITACGSRLPTPA
jgi:hypothetical protein